MKRKALLSHGSAVIDDAIVLLQAFKQGRIDADSPLAGPLVELLGDELYRRKPHLWLPTDIIKKILMFLSASECWRICKKLHPVYKKWAKTAIEWLMVKINTYRNGTNSSSHRTERGIRYAHSKSNFVFYYPKFYDEHDQYMENTIYYTVEVYINNVEIQQLLNKNYYNKDDGTLCFYFEKNISILFY